MTRFMSDQVRWRRWLTLLPCIVLAHMSPAAGDDAPWSGEWDLSDRGNPPAYLLELTQTETLVTGTYSRDQNFGVLRGMVRGSRLVGSWDSLSQGKRLYGTFELQIDAAGKRLRGYYVHHQADAKRRYPGRRAWSAVSREKAADPYADAWVAWSPGVPASNEGLSEPAFALGAPNFRGSNFDPAIATLGCGGSITVRFIDNTLTDGGGADLRIYEPGDVEAYGVEISTDGSSWRSLESSSGANTDFDISPVAAPGEEFYFVRITDLRSFCRGTRPGADIDAVKALNTGDQGPVKAEAPPLPDLQIKSFAITRRDGASGDYWEITADILSAGGDTPDRFNLRLEAVNALREGEPAFRPVTNGETSHPALAAGESATITWRTDRSTPTADRPNVITDLHRAIRVAVDPENAVEEADETNNVSALWRLSCADPVTITTPKSEVIWVVLPEGEAVPGAAPESYDVLLDAMADKAEAVLCRIKLEAQRRAQLGIGTVAGSRFVKTLAANFLKDYLAAPSRDSALAAIAALGEPQGYPSAGLGNAMHVPEGLRQRYPNHAGDWAWIYPATQFWVHTAAFDAFVYTYVHTFFGNNARLIRYLDVPFLVGSRNLGTGGDADVSGGGKNLSNVMHFATGVKYWHLPKNALRELFVGYEQWHLEGWDIFGEDAINDLIGEETGRMLGVRLARNTHTIRSERDLVQTLDRDFGEARAWVGAMLRLRQDKFDELILSPTMPKSVKWHGWFRKPPQAFPPWPRGSSAKTIRMMLDDGATVAQVSKTSLVEQLTQIYTLIYEVDEWERRHGDVGLTDVMRNVVEGAYDDQFKAAPKNWGAVWHWSP